MVLAVEVVHREAARERLLIPGLRPFGRVAVARLARGLETDRELDPGQRQQVPHLGGIKDIRGDQRPLVAGAEVAHDDRPDPIPVDLGANRGVFQQDQELPRRRMRREHRREDRQRHLRFVAKA